MNAVGNRRVTKEKERRPLLNEQQWEAVQAEGDVYVTALPGTGKTKTLCHRIAYLVREKQVRPESILAVTFSRKAVQDIRRQLTEVLADRPALAQRVYVCTFHGLMLKVLRSSKMKSQLITKEWEKFALLQPILKQHHMEEEEGVEALQILSLSKNKGVWLHKLPVENKEEKQLLTVMQAYEKYRAEKEKMDFDDIMVQCLVKLATDSRMAELLQRSFQYVMLDEMQDLCKLQVDLLGFLKGDNTHIFVCGDPFQSIYGFRGAEPRNLLSLQKLLDKPKSVQLTLNYRSSPAILALANSVLGESGVYMQAHNQDTGTPPLFLLPEDRGREAEEITIMIKDSPVSYADQCVLTRTGDYVRPLIEALVKEEIPLNIQGDLTLLYDQLKVKPLMAHLRMMTGRQQKGDLRLILMLLNIHPWKHQALLSGDGNPTLTDLVTSKHLDPLDLEKVLDLLERYDELSSLPPMEVVQALRVDHYDGYLLKGLDLLSEKRHGLLDKMEELEEALSSHKSLKGALDFLDTMNKAMDHCDPKGLKVMSIHAAKGLEFSSVYLVGAVEGQLPHQRSLMESPVLFRTLHPTMAEALEEEKRLAYVAVTRAREKLVISAPQTIKNKSAVMSRFFRGFFTPKTRR